MCLVSFVRPQTVISRRNRQAAESHHHEKNRPFVPVEAIVECVEVERVLLVSATPGEGFVWDEVGTPPASSPYAVLSDGVYLLDTILDVAGADEGDGEVFLSIGPGDDTDD